MESKYKASQQLHTKQLLLERIRWLSPATSKGKETSKRICLFVAMSFYSHVPAQEMFVKFWGKLHLA